MSQVEWDYHAQPQVSTACPVCARENPSVRLTDRVGYPIGASACVCGLRYLNPRMTPASYAAFYASGAYRAITQRFIPAEHREGMPLWRQMEADADATRIASMVTKAREGVDLLDVGGGSGRLAAALVARRPMRSVTILDPNIAELEQAAAKGFRTVCANAEDQPALGPFGGIVCVRSLDHFCDPLTVLRWWRTICPGWLWVDIITDAPWKIDHPLYWSRASLRQALKHTGWTVQAHTSFALGRRWAVLCE